MPPEQMPHRYSIVLTTAGSDESARQIATALVERRVAACVNLIPGVVSTYRWEGGVQTDTERLLVVKTSEERIPEVQATIREMHDYEIPEILVVPVAGGSTDYLGWIAESVLP